MARPQAPGEIFRFIEEKRLSIEVLINNAGFGAYGEFRKAEAQRLLDMVQVNIASVVHLTHLFLPAMVERRSGYILIVASTAAFQPVPYISTYAATKGFDLLFAEGLSEEARRYGVHVCALCPGSTVSEFHEVRVSRCIWRDRRSRTKRWRGWVCRRWRKASRASFRELETG